MLLFLIDTFKDYIKSKSANQLRKSLNVHDQKPVTYSDNNAKFQYRKPNLKEPNLKVIFTFSAYSFGSKDNFAIAYVMS